MTAPTSPQPAASDGQPKKDALFLRQDSGAKIALPADGRLILGSAAGTAGLVLQGANIDEVHCALSRETPRGWSIQDLGSQSGTFVNDNRIERIDITPGDVIRLGSVELTLEDGKRTPASTPRKRTSSREFSKDALGPDKRIGGFLLQRRLGTGGMGIVWLARQESLDRPVALKLLSPRLARDAAFVARFQAEARAAAALSHPNVVVVYDVGSADGQHFLAMEFMAGGSLEDDLTSEGPLPWRDAVQALRDCAEGLVYAEERGIVHRDVKPDNLMRTNAGAVKLADLGLATSTGSETGDGRILGTPHFLAPEQAKGGAPDHRSDLYSLGATAYRLLTARNPFQGKTSRDIVRAHLTEDPLPPSAHVSGLPPELDAIVLSMLAKDPEDRPQTAAQVSAQLGALLNGGATAGRSGSKLFVGIAVALLIAAAAYFLIPKGDGPIEDDDPGLNGGNTVSQTVDGNDGATAGDTEVVESGQGGGTEDGGFFDPVSIDGTADAAVEEALDRRELRAQLALASLSPQLTPELEIVELRAIEESFQGTPTARGIAGRIATLELKMQRETEEAGNQSRAFDLAYATLAQTVGWPAAEGTGWDIGETLQSLFNTVKRPYNTTPLDPESGDEAPVDSNDLVAASDGPGADSGPDQGRAKEDPVLDSGTGDDEIGDSEGATTAEVPQAIEEIPAITAARKQLADEIVVRAIAELSGVSPQLNSALENADFELATSSMAATIARTKLPKPPESLEPARWGELVELVQVLHARGQGLTSEVATRRQAVAASEHAGLAQVIGPVGSLRDAVSANDWNASLAAIDSYATAALSPETSARAGLLATQLRGAQSAIELLIETRASGEWRRRSASLPVAGRSRPTEIKDIDATGLQLLVDNVEQKLGWSDVIPFPDAVSGLFKGRFSRTLTGAEQRSILQLLRVSAALRGAQLADQVLAPNSQSNNLNSREAEELSEVFDHANDWLEGMGLGNTNDPLIAELAQDQLAAQLLRSALEAYQESRWTQAVSDMDALLGGASDSLLVAFLSEGTDSDSSNPTQSDR